MFKEYTEIISDMITVYEINKDKTIFANLSKYGYEEYKQSRIIYYNIYDIPFLNKYLRTIKKEKLQAIEYILRNFTDIKKSKLHILMN